MRQIDEIFKATKNEGVKDRIENSGGVALQILQIIKCKIISYEIARFSLYCLKQTLV